MTRIASALIPLALLLCACAPMPAGEAPAGSPAPGGDSDTVKTQAETPETEPSESKHEAATRSKVAEPAPSRPQEAHEPSEPPPPEPAPERESEPETEPRPGLQASGETQAEPKPAPEPEPSPNRAAAAESIVVSGRITLTGGDADAEEAVVYFIPEDPSVLADGAAKPATEEIVTRDKALSPTVLAVSRGSEVRFPNDDPILHNLFSVSAENGFDLGVYGPGEAPSVSFEQPGVVNIYCNVHHNMHAHVLVVDTPWRTRPDAQGNFRLADLPPTPGVLHIWHRQSDRWSLPLDLPADPSIEATLEVTKPRLPPHRDKAGQSYNRRDRDPYR